MKKKMQKRGADMDRQTVDYIESLPESRRAELIEGRVFDMAAPGRFHQEIVSDLTWSIQNYIRGKKGGCKVYPSPFAVYINNDKYNYLEPDVTVVCDRDKLDNKGCHGAPDWVIEVISPSSVWLDCVIKLEKYRISGVRLYWLINPDRRLVNVYDFENKASGVYGFDEQIPVSIYPDFGIRMDELLDDSLKKG